MEGRSKWNAECVQLYCRTCAILGVKRHCLCNIWNLPRRGGRKELLEVEVCKYRRQGQGGGGTIH